MLSVVIPTADSEEGLARTLASLVPGAAEGVVREVVVADRGSRDGTRIVADAAGCTLIEAGGGWVERVGAGLAASRRAPWYLLLPPNVFLEGDWFREAAAFVDRAERSGRGERAIAVFRIAYDEFGWRARIAEKIVSIAGSLFGAPICEQGLLVSRRALDVALAALPAGAGHSDLVARLGRSAVQVLRADAVVLPPSGGGTAIPSPATMLCILLAGFRR